MSRLRGEPDPGGYPHESYRERIMWDALAVARTCIVREPSAVSKAPLALLAAARP